MLAFSHTVPAQVFLRTNVFTRESCTEWLKILSRLWLIHDDMIEDHSDAMLFDE